MSDDITFCMDEISESEIKEILINRNKKWRDVKDGSNDVNCSMRTVVLACIDSRVPVEKVFQAKPGELLVLKNAGNLITTDMLRSILVAVLELKAKYVVIMGHTECGMAIKDNPEKINHLKELISPNLVEKIKKSEQRDILEWFGFFNQNEWVENAKSQGKILHGYLNEFLPQKDHPIILVALYDLKSGEVRFIN